MFLSLSSHPEGSARNPEQLQKFVWEKGGDVREVGTYSGKEHPSHSPPTSSFNALYSQQNDEDKERSGTDSHTIAAVFILKLLSPSSLYSVSETQCDRFIAE
jgi:hypothetical protein